ncbi:P-loop ATPase, Sll1717 family [Kaistella solincola]|uniref:P-loop ATPase, Sll1717 family n=1 Tax=Kaistella solincola TaxID=510955 RepID=UPI0012EB873C|nr:hypothetical protein [Kaistella solincola]
MKKNLYESLGFVNNPFSKRSSEQELGFIDDIFYEPNYYSTLQSDLTSGDTRFIIGQRGHGKSSVINKLFKDLEDNESLLVVKVDRFDNIPLRNNNVDFLLLIIKGVITKLSTNLLSNKKLIKRLNKHEKEKLSFFIKTFFRPLSESEYSDVCNKVKKVNVTNFFIRIFNLFGVDIANSLTSSAVNITSNFIRQSLGVDSINNSELHKEYFKKVSEIQIGKNEINSENCSKEELKHVLDDIFLVFSKMGLSKIIVLFDKIDEYQELNQEIQLISNFTKDLLADNEFLLNENIAIGFSLWSELRSELSGTVRFDKHGIIDVRWNSHDLVPLIEKRLSYFSDSKKITVKHLFRNEVDIKDLLSLSNNSPRDLIFLLSEIYNRQANINSAVKYFEDKAIRDGMISFCKVYDYDSLFPSKVGRNKEIKAMINRLLQLKKTSFSKKELTTYFSQTAAQSEGQIKLMQNYGLVRKEEILLDKDTELYEIIDPKVEFLIKHLEDRIE